MGRWLLMLVVPLLVAGGCGGDDDRTVPTTSASAPTTTAVVASTTVANSIDLELAGGKVVGGIKNVTVAVGAQVVIHATSDVAEELHVHTYDLTVDLGAGQPGQVAFVASIPGRHEVEFEKSKRTALILEVR